MKKKLVIWDFDGVIADSKKIWLKNRQESINKKFNLDWDFQTVNKYLGGMNDKTKKEVLDSLGYVTDDAFWDDQLEIDKKVICRDGLDITPGVENIIKSLKIKQCIATSGAKEKTIIKLELIGFWKKYFNENNVFTADLVQKGKPEPDLFLIAAQKMGEKKEDCIIVEDSIVGMLAAQKAGIDLLAFLGSDMYKNNDYINRVKEIGVKNICFDMKEIEKILLSLNCFK